MTKNILDNTELNVLKRGAGIHKPLFAVSVLRILSVSLPGLSEGFLFQQYIDIPTTSNTTIVPQMTRIMINTVSLDSSIK